MNKSPFDIGEWLFYTNEGHTSMVTVKDIIISSHDSATKFTVEFPTHRRITTTADAEIAEIPVTGHTKRFLRGIHQIVLRRLQVTRETGYFIARTTRTHELS